MVGQLFSSKINSGTDRPQVFSKAFFWELGSPSVAKHDSDMMGTWKLLQARPIWKTRINAASKLELLQYMPMAGTQGTYFPLNYNVHVPVTINVIACTINYTVVWPFTSMTMLQLAVWSTGGPNHTKRTSGPLMYAVRKCVHWLLDVKVIIMGNAS
jgi:hypothetical protein